MTDAAEQTNGTTPTVQVDYAGGASPQQANQTAYAAYYQPQQQMMQPAYYAADPYAAFNPMNMAAAAAGDVAQQQMVATMAAYAMAASGVSPYPSPFLGPTAAAASHTTSTAASNSPSPYLSPFGYAAGNPYFAAAPGGFLSQQPSPFLHPVGLSPTLSAVSSAPNSPKMAGKSNGNGAAATATAGAANMSPHPATSWTNLQLKSAYDAFTENMTEQQLSTNVYIRGLSPSVSDDALVTMCSAYGQIVSSKSIIDQKSGECKGFGFAMYATEDQARYAVQQLNAKGFQASFAKESFSTRLKNLQDPTSTNIYLSNLSLNLDEARLDELFRPYKIISARILRDTAGVSRGVGFARMEDRDSALAIIQKFNGFVVPGSNVPLQVRFADSAAQKKLKSQTQRKRMWRAQESKMSQSYTGEDGGSGQGYGSQGDIAYQAHLGVYDTNVQNMSYTPQLGPSNSAYGYQSAASMMAYSQAATMAAYANAFSAQQAAAVAATGCSPYMQPQMLAAYGYAPTSQLPTFSLPEASAAGEGHAHNGVGSNGDASVDNVCSMMNSMHVSSAAAGSNRPADPVGADK